MYIYAFKVLMLWVYSHIYIFYVRTFPCDVKITTWHVKILSVCRNGLRQVGSRYYTVCTTKWSSQRMQREPCVHPDPMAPLMQRSFHNDWPPGIHGLRSLMSNTSRLIRRRDISANARNDSVAVALGPFGRVDVTLLDFEVITSCKHALAGKGGPWPTST